jgi:carbonic anhydrase
MIGHTNCGACHAALHPSNSTPSHVDKWIMPLYDLVAKNSAIFRQSNVTDEVKMERLAELKFCLLLIC